ncbi:MAG: hypothetical protein P4L46_11855 [Fimbriimonas sp.]|nr:hypothetical protein [Fimbriimonas sp.]
MARGYTVSRGAVGSMFAAPKWARLCQRKAPALGTGVADPTGPEWDDSAA